MAQFECRLCGNLKPESEVALGISSSKDVEYFLNVIEHFCKIEVFRDSSDLSKVVCMTCRSAFEEFVNFCEEVKKHQLKLKNRSLVKLQPPEDEQQPRLESPASFQDALDDLVNGFDDEELDSPVSAGSEVTDIAQEREPEGESATAKAQFGLRQRTQPLPEMKDCSVTLERLPIKYVHFDSDGEDKETDEDEDVPLSALKRKRVSDGVENPTPSKRMRVSPAKVKPEPANRPPLRLTIKLPIEPTTSNQERLEETAPPPQVEQTMPRPSNHTTSALVNFKSYHQLFLPEFNTKYSQSPYNLPIPGSARQSDGSMHEDFAEKFTPWSGITLKCPFKNEKCDRRKEEMSPYEMLLHKRQCHRLQDEEFFFCEKCPVEKLKFTQFFQHIVEKHYKHLRYCCLICSKMFYNFTALFYHYTAFHPAFKGSYICLHDGYLYETFLSLQMHVEGHAIMSKSHRTIKVDKKKRENSVGKENKLDSSDEEESVVVTTSKRKYSCEICREDFISSGSLTQHSRTFHDLNNGISHDNNNSTFDQ